MRMLARKAPDRRQLFFDWTAAAAPAAAEPDDPPIPTDEEEAHGHERRDPAGRPPVFPGEAASPGNATSIGPAELSGARDVDAAPSGDDGARDAGQSGIGVQPELAGEPGGRTGDESAHSGPAGEEPSERPAEPAEAPIALRSVQEGPARPSPDLPEPERNHRIGDELLAPAGQVGKIKANLRALEMLRALETENRLPTSDEKRVLAQYTGWGHSPQVFDDLKAEYWKSHLEGDYSYGYNQDPEGLENWAGKFYEHHRALKEMLTPEEWSRAEASTLNAHYTSREVIEHGLWGIARHLGFDGGRVLENSAGIGHVLGPGAGSHRGKLPPHRLRAGQHHRTNAQAALSPGRSPCHGVPGCQDPGPQPGSGHRQLPLQQGGMGGRQVPLLAAQPVSSPAASI